LIEGIRTVFRRLLLTTLLMAPVPAFAQESRYELGQRLQAFEQTWDRLKPDSMARRRALSGLQSTFRNFFSLRLSEAGRSLDQARWALESANEPPFARQWADSLSIVPESRFLDAESKSLSLRVRAFYAVKGEIPKSTKLRVTLNDTSKEFDLAKLPTDISFALPAFTTDTDSRLTFTVVVGNDEYPFSQSLSRVAKRDERLKVLEAIVEKLPEQPTSLEDGSIRHLNDLVKSLRDGTVPETNYPAARLLNEAESIAKNAKFYGPERAGQFWLRVPLDNGSIVVRMLIPKKLAKGKVPLVVALHGAGGSENLFFDGYGDGAVVKACEERGWILIATRSPGFIGAPPVVQVIDQLAKRFPIDTEKVYLIGHSMGASQSISIATRDPKRFAGVVALGGGGLVRKSDDLASLPFFIGVGKEDFALSSSRSLAKSLETSGAKKVVLKEYADIEHMVIVREAIDDIFAWMKD